MILYNSFKFFKAVTDDEILFLFKKKDKKKLGGLMDRIASASKLKKPRSSDVEAASLSDSSISHSRYIVYTVIFCHFK
jgi:hypothetical protein